LLVKRFVPGNQIMAPIGQALYREAAVFSRDSEEGDGRV
jgi:hypothetical protein